MLTPSHGTQYELVAYRGKLALAVGRGKDRRRISTGTNDRGLASVIAKQIWERLHAPASERVQDLWELYLADRRRDGRDITRQANAWKRLDPVFGQRVGRDIGKDDCREYARLRQRQGAAPGTAKIELEYLHSHRVASVSGENGLEVPRSSSWLAVVKRVEFPSE